MRRLVDGLKSAWIVFWWAAASVVFFVPITLAGLVEPAGRLAFQLCRGWTFWATVIGGVRVETVGTDRIDRSRSYIIISNHQSLYDIPTLMLGLGLQFRWVIKKAYIYVPLFGWALYLTRHIFIDRSSPKASIRQMKDAARALRPGVSVAVFAEGTRSDDGVVRQFKKGGFLMALAAGLPVLPVTVNGSWRRFPNKRSLAIIPGPIQLVVGEPIETEGLGDGDLADLITRARDAVIGNLDPDYPVH